MLKALLFGTMGPLLINGCAVQLKDAQFCSPVPGGFGAVCDNFLTSNQLILNESEWSALQNDWVSSGQSVECTQARTLGDLKGEIEKLCSLTACDYQTQKKIIKGLEKIQLLGKDSRVVSVDAKPEYGHD